MSLSPNAASGSNRGIVPEGRALSLLRLLRLALLPLREWRGVAAVNIRHALRIVDLFRYGGGNRRVRALTPAAASAPPAPASSARAVPARRRFIRLAG